MLKTPTKQNLQKDYKTLDENSFNNDLKLKLDSIKNLTYSSFEDIFINILNKYSRSNRN